MSAVLWDVLCVQIITKVLGEPAASIIVVSEDWTLFNPLAPELLFFILAYPVYKMWIIQEPNKLGLWNKLHFEEKKKESVEHV